METFYKLGGPTQENDILILDYKLHRARLLFVHRLNRAWHIVVDQ